MDTEGIQVVPPLLVQVAYRDGSGRCTVILESPATGRLSDDLVSLLGDGGVAKAFCDAYGDVAALGCPINGIVDVQRVALASWRETTPEGVARPAMGLGALGSRYAFGGAPVVKNKKGWAFFAFLRGRPAAPWPQGRAKLCDYAAADAWITLEVYEAMRANRVAAPGAAHPGGVGSVADAGSSADEEKAREESDGEELEERRRPRGISFEAPSFPPLAGLASAQSSRKKKKKRSSRSSSGSAPVSSSPGSMPPSSDRAVVLKGSLDFFSSSSSERKGGAEKSLVPRCSDGRQQYSRPPRAGGGPDSPDHGFPARLAPGSASPSLRALEVPHRPEGSPGGAKRQRPEGKGAGPTDEIAPLKKRKKRRASGKVLAEKKSPKGQLGGEFSVVG